MSSKKRRKGGGQGRGGRGRGGRGGASQQQGGTQQQGAHGLPKQPEECHVFTTRHFMQYCNNVLLQPIIQAGGKPISHATNGKEVAAQARLSMEEKEEGNLP